MNTKTVFSTKNGNGFKAFELYKFELMNSPGVLYCCKENGEKVDSLDGKKSAHLWDGIDWDNAGVFIEVHPLKYRAQIVKMAAYKLAMLGFETYISSSEEYGFFVNSNGFSISFQADFSQIKLSGNYAPINSYDGRTVGTGWSDNVDLFSVDGLTLDNLKQWVSVDRAPHWATRGLPVRLLNAVDKLKNTWAGYKQIILSGEA